MKRFHLNLLVVVLSLVFAACEDNKKEVEDWLSVVPSGLVFSADDAAEKSMTVETNVHDWNVSANNSWITATKGDGKIMVRVTAYDVPSVLRNGTITVTAGSAKVTVHVTQYGVQLNTLSINQRTLTFDAGFTGAKNVEVDTNAENWDAETTVDWINITKAGKTLIVAVNELNYATVVRTAEITFSVENVKPVILTIKQVPTRSTLSVDKTSLIFMHNSITEKKSVKVISNSGWKIDYASDWLSLEKEGDDLHVTVNQANLNKAPLAGQITITAGNAEPVTIEVKINLSIFAYEDLLGSYTMRFTNGSAQPPNRTRSLTVNLEQATQGKTYYLKGILTEADEALGNIIVNYDQTKGIKILGHLLFVRPETNYDCQWLVFGLNTTGGLISAIGSNTSLGLEGSPEFNFSSGTFSFTMVDNGAWAPSQSIGFRARNYVGTTSQGDVNGRDGQPSYFFPLFEKK